MPAADPLNPSFETAGVGPGKAQDWTVTISFTGWTIGDFSGGGAPTPIEQFDQTSFASVVTSGTPSIFDVGQSPAPSSVEGFDYWTGNAHFTSAIGNGIAGEFAGASTLETFDEPAAAYVTTVTGGVTFFESFGGDYSAAYSTGYSGTSGTFYRGLYSLEDFQSVQADVVFSVPSPPSATLTTPTPHGLVVGRKMTVRSTGSPPAGLTTNTPYFVVSTATTTTLQISLTSGGSAITLTSSGIGTHSLHADETLFWTDGP